MGGLYKFISFVCIYYLFISVIDLYGSILSYRASINSPYTGVDIKFKVDFNTDMASICVIYLVSYYSGVFE